MRSRANASPDLAEAALFDDAPLFHYQDTICHARLHMCRVADQQNRDAQLGFQFSKQRKKAGLRQSVKRSGGLIGDYDFRLTRKSLRENHPLELPSAELMRIRSVNPVDWHQSNPRQPTPRLDATLRPIPFPVRV
jgi:hypothetical protein